MFSLRDIDDQIYVFNRAADDLEEKAAAYQDQPLSRSLMLCHADGLREAARSLERMVERTIEREAREAMRQ